MSEFGHYADPIAGKNIIAFSDNNDFEVVPLECEYKANIGSGSTIGQKMIPLTKLKVETPFCMKFEDQKESMGRLFIDIKEGSGLIQFLAFVAHGRPKKFHFHATKGVPLRIHWIGEDVNRVEIRLKTKSCKYMSISGGFNHPKMVLKRKGGKWINNNSQR